MVAPDVQFLRPAATTCSFGFFEVAAAAARRVKGSTSEDFISCSAAEYSWRGRPDALESHCPSRELERPWSWKRMLALARVLVWRKW